MAAGRGEMEPKRSSRTDSYHSESDDEHEEEPNFSDSEDYVDDVTDEELLGDLLKKSPKETDGMDSVIVVDNVPQVGQDRVEKLKSVLRKIFSRFGNIVAEHYPEENGTTKGYVFLEYSSPQHALEAVKQANHYKLDKSHIFLVNLFSDFDRFHDVADNYEEPKSRPFQDPGDLKAWLTNKECYDQFSVIFEGGDQTAIFLNTPEPTVLDKRFRWTETYVRWSPKGSYLATCHSKGIALWGGDDFSQKSKFNHNRVQLLDFSPCERYLITLNNSAGNTEDAIIVWDIRTGHKKRSFSCEQEVTWPIFKWNHDGAYFARIGHDAISVYETPSFGLLGKKSIKITDVRDFTWSPTDNIIAYWVPEEENTPARVTLIEIPSRQEVCVRNLFNVADCKMHWQQNGDYLCVKVDRYSKARKVEEKNQYKYSGIYVNFEIFRIREKQIPVDKVEVKENVLAFAWEPVGSRFSYIHGEAPRISVSFHNVANTGKVDQLKTFEKRTANHLFWSPTGQFIVLAGLRSMNGVLEFIDTNDMTVMSQTEHFMATDVEWDPTGRYVVSAVSWWGHKVDNAFWIWSFQGTLLQKVPMERFCQLLWRPRPKSLLTDAQIKQVKKNFKTYAQRFEVEDSLRKKTASKEMLEKRKKMYEEYQAYRQEKKAEFKKRKKERLSLRGGIDTDELHSHEENFCEEVVEFLISVEETLVEE